MQPLPPTFPVSIIHLMSTSKLPLPRLPPARPIPPLPRFLTKGNLDYFSFLTKFIVMLIFLFTFIALPQVKVPSSIPVPPF